MYENQIIDTNYQEINNEEVVYYSTEQVANKLNVSETKIHHLIFKFNKMSKNNNFFERTDKISQTDFDKIELILDLLNSDMGYDEVVEYFEKNMNGLINRKTGEIKQDLNKIDSQVIAKSVTVEIVKKMNALETKIIDTITGNVTESFKEEAKKIAQLSLDAMNQTKDIMLNSVDVLTNKMQSLEENNQAKDKELERLYSKETTAMRNKIDKKQEEIENLKKELAVEKNKSLIDRILKR